MRVFLFEIVNLLWNLKTEAKSNITYGFATGYVLVYLDNIYILLHMNKKLLLFSLSAVLGFGAMAAPLTPEQALQRARQDGPARIKAKVTAGMKPVYSAAAQNGTVAAYVFNTPGQGYMILGADDVAYPVLGYSETGSIDVANMSPELKWWLGEYARQVEWAVSKGAKEALRAPGYAESDRPAIATQLTTKWNQDAPYYDLCPKTKDGQQCYTGCVATSMAQVMNYHKYPEHGVGIKQYTCSSIGRRLTINFEQKNFDWANMLNVYDKGAYNDAQADAVAYLMKACGYAVEMGYGPDSSGASGSVIGSAIREYFLYDEGCESRQRLIYSGSQWEDMIYNNLKEVGPVIINGQSPLSGGHSFVCDGYDGKGYYHFNWGWGGMSDGYYSLDALNPDAQGIGGATGGFNFMQNGIFGIQPPTGKPAQTEELRILQWGTTQATVSGGVITFDAVDFTPTGWTCAADRELNANIGAIIEPVDGTAGETLDVQGSMGSRDVLSFSGYGSYYSSTNWKPSVTLPNLGDGKYRVTLACRNADVEGSQWTPVAVPWGFKNYVLLTVNGSEYTVTNVSMESIAISDLELASPLYAAKNALLKAKFTNNSDIELVQGLSPVLFNASGKAQFYGESILVSLAPGQSIEKEWVVRFYNQNGSNSSVSAATNFTMKFYDPDTRLYFDDVEIPVTMQPSPGSTKIMLTGFGISNALRREEVTSNGHTFPVVSFVGNAKDIKATLSFKITSGFFDGLLTMGISKQNPENPDGIIPVVDQVYSALPFLPKNETFSVEVPVDFPEAEEGVVYFLTAQYTMGAAMNSLGRLPFMLDTTGIDEVGTENDAPETYYNLLGVRIDNPMPGQIVIVRKGAKSFKRIWK